MLFTQKWHAFFWVVVLFCLTIIFLIRLNYFIFYYLKRDIFNLNLFLFRSRRFGRRRLAVVLAR
jgi:hypothetical protein